MTEFLKAIGTHQTWRAGVIDKSNILFPLTLSNSSLQSATSCRKRWYYSKILHLQKASAPSQHLIAGGLFASAIEKARITVYHEGKSQQEALEAGRELILEGQDTGDFYKSNENTASAFERYLEAFPLDGDFKPCTLEDGTKAVEYFFEIDTGIAHPDFPDRNILYTGYLDGFYEHWDKGELTGIYVVDEKTTGKLSRVPNSKCSEFPKGRVDLKKEENNFRLSGQMIGYCLTGDHEVLTRNGWVRLDAIKGLPEIMCWDNGVMDFQIPTEYIKQSYKGNLVEYSGQIELLGTPNHRQVVRNRKTKTYKTYTLETVPLFKDLYQIPTSGMSLEDGEEELDYLRLLISFQADGSWDLNSKTLALKYSFAKSRKRDRLKRILDSLGVRYKENFRLTKAYKGGVEYTFYISDKFIVARLWEDLGKSKTFNPVLLSLNGLLLEKFLKELQYWDGWRVTIKGKPTKRWVYNSCNFENIKLVQTVAHLCGYLGNIQESQNHKRNPKHSRNWDVYITKEIHKAVSRQNKRQIPYDGDVYCMSVPSTFFMVRRKGRIMITGNSVVAQLQGLKANALIRRVPISNNPEPPIELEIHINQYMRDQWVESTFSLIEDLVEKYRRLGSEESVVSLFGASYGSSCHSWGELCPFAQGCLGANEELMMLASCKQGTSVMKDKNTRVLVPLETYKRNIKEGKPLWSM